MASIQHSNPALRNDDLAATPSLPPVRVATLGVDRGLALPSVPYGITLSPAPQPDTAPERKSLSPRDAVPEGKTSQPHTPARSASVTAPVDMPGDEPDITSLSGEEVSMLAPAASLRPLARPASMERRVVQYTRAWLRTIDMRAMTEEETCLATAIYHEARGESVRGQFGVAEVILNRVESRKFPDTICGVVYQGVQSGRIGGCQFSFACDGNSEAMPNRRAAGVAQRIAQVFSEGAHRGLTMGALYFHTHAVSPDWANRFTQTTHIGAHLFYRG